VTARYYFCSVTDAVAPLLNLTNGGSDAINKVAVAHLCLQANGPDFRYCPKPAKTILLIKDSSLMQSAQKILKNDGIKITDQGERLLGSLIGTESFREQYIKNKVQGWVKDLQSLSK